MKHAAVIFLRIRASERLAQFESNIIEFRVADKIEMTLTPPKSEEIIAEDLIAHKGRMKLIQEVLEFSTRKAVTRSKASPDWPLAEQDAVHPLILLELIAQTAGICNAWQLVQRQGLGTDVRGWLVGIKEARFFISSISVNTPIIVTAENKFEFESFREIKGEAFINNKLAAKATLQVVQAHEK